MIKSMTGFGRSEYSDSKRTIHVELKSVNHRYCDINVRMPRRFSFAEEYIKGLIKTIAKRGKIEVSVMVEDIAASDTVIQLNSAMAQQYINNLEQLKQEFGIEGDISLQYIASLPEVMKTVPKLEDEEEILAALRTPVIQAAQNLDSMRCAEGKKLAGDILMRRNLILNYIVEIEDRSPIVCQEYMQRLKERIQELIGSSDSITEERILTEAAIFADKSNVTEETVRLKSHILQLEKVITNSKEPDGKKLDFLVQEMNREANTIGSKANDLRITNIVVEIKSEIEKIREQVQNIE